MYEWTYKWILESRSDLRMRKRTTHANFLCKLFNSLLVGAIHKRLTIRDGLFLRARALIKHLPVCFRALLFTLIYLYIHLYRYIWLALCAIDPLKDKVTPAMARIYGQLCAYSAYWQYKNYFSSTIQRAISSLFI